MPERITRIERGLTNDVAWHVRRPDGGRYWIVWYGPGSRLRLAFSPTGSMTLIDHPSANDSYRTFKDANAAAKRFIASAQRDRSRTKAKAWEVWSLGNGDEPLFIEAFSDRENARRRIARLQASQRRSGMRPYRYELRRRTSARGRQFEHRRLGRMH